MEETIHQLNPELPLFNVNPLSVTMQLGSLFGRVAATFAGSFGLLAMLLAAVGIYGVVAYSTRQRSREIGIRMALGAEKRGIYGLVLGQGFRLTLAGLIVGTALAVAFTRLLKAQLFGVSETDAITFASSGCFWPLSLWSRATSPPAAPRGLIRWSHCGTNEAYKSSRPDQLF